MQLNDRTPLVQFIKFIIVGLINTAVTLIIIYICKSLLEINLYLSNLIGYVAGVINSFLWNRSWVFKSKDHNCRRAVVFLVGFGICYLLQLGTVYLLTRQYGSLEWTFASYTISGYGVATLIGMCVYTAANFIYNRVVTFR